jgi:hypothetical protein
MSKETSQQNNTINNNDNDNKINIFPDVNTIKKSLANKVEEFSEEKQRKKELFDTNIQAASDEYYDNLLENIKNAIGYMSKQQSAYSCVYVNVPTSRLKWGEEDSEKYIPWHWIHYGFPRRGRKGWTNRDTKFWNTTDNKMIFRQLQDLSLKNGYYLYDISDPTRGTRTFFKISVNKEEEFESLVLWHNLNKIDDSEQQPSE